MAISGHLGKNSAVMVLAHHKFVFPNKVSTDLMHLVCALGNDLGGVTAMGDEIAVIKGIAQC